MISPIIFEFGRKIKKKCLRRVYSGGLGTSAAITATGILQTIIQITGRILNSLLIRFVIVFLLKKFIPHGLCPDNTH